MQDQHQHICSRLGSGSEFCFGLRRTAICRCDGKGGTVMNCGSSNTQKIPTKNSWPGPRACTIHTASRSNRSAFKHATPATLQLAPKEHIVLDTLLSHAAKPWKQVTADDKCHKSINKSINESINESINKSINFMFLPKKLISC